MKHKILVGFFTVLAISAGTADAGAQTKKQSFEEFRKSIKGDFQEFRKTLLDHYADFLNGEWHEYQSLNAERRYKQPKPKIAPQVSEPKANKPERPAVSVSKPANPTNAVPEEVAPVIMPPQQKRMDVDEFSFYGMPMQLRHVDFDIEDKLYANTDYAMQWRSLEKLNVGKKLAEDVKDVAKQAGLNDYLIYKLIESFADSRFADKDATSRLSLVQYILAHMGYDVRIAVTEKGVPLLLMPFQQTIYGRQYMLIGNQKYYVFDSESSPLGKGDAGKIITCRLPEDAQIGKKMDLVLGELRLPEKPKSFEFEYGKLHLKGEVNENLMPVLYHYPQMPVGDFAQSNLQPELRQELVRQMREQLHDMQPDEAVAELLSFMHNVFNYATDEENHGFEKPYFLEETLYYPKNDCEDRAIFYTWFLWNALGREAQLVSFPGHEAATVKLDTHVAGTAYEYEGKRFYISDPTFIGSRTGQVMPNYRTISPTVDYTYK